MQNNVVHQRFIKQTLDTTDNGRKPQSFDKTIAHGMRIQEKKQVTMDYTSETSQKKQKSEIKDCGKCGKRYRSSIRACLQCVDREEQKISKKVTTLNTEKGKK